MRLFSLSFAAGVALALFTAACSQRDAAAPPRFGPVARVELMPAISTLIEGDTLRLRAIPRDSAGIIVPRTRALWSSSNPAVATIDSLGLIGARAAGQTLIRVEVVGVVAVASLLVRSQASTRFVLAAAGAEHSCAVTGEGAVYCWGGNTFGQLGTATVASSIVPVAVQVESGASAIAVANRHSCAAVSRVGVWCWGSNSAGQLGDSVAGRKVQPAPVVALSDVEVIALTAGSGHTCALTEEGAALCWGSNGLGQLGRGRVEPLAGPAEVIGELRFTSLTAGQGHSCGVTTGGDVYCWGWNQFGQVGVGSAEACSLDGTPCRTWPVRVTLPGRMRSVSAGFGFTCALAENGASYCWGLNAEGQLGTGALTSASSPGLVRGPSFVALDAGARHACGLTSTGAVYCWGGNLSGELGSSSVANSSLPIAAFVPVLRSIDAGSAHTCGVTTRGTVFCWGDPGAGRLGLGEPLGYRASSNRFILRRRE